MKKTKGFKISTSSGMISSKTLKKIMSSKHIKKMLTKRLNDMKKHITVQSFVKVNNFNHNLKQGDRLKIISNGEIIYGDITFVKDTQPAPFRQETEITFNEISRRKIKAKGGKK